MLGAQSAHKMKKVMSEVDSSTAYMVFDFKQKFLAKGFCEGGDSYYGEKGMWWGAGMYATSWPAEPSRQPRQLPG